MSEIWDSKTGFCYPEKRYAIEEATRHFASSKNANSKIDTYCQNLSSIRKIPTSPIEKKKIFKNSYFNLKNCKALPDEQNIFGNLDSDFYEKPWPSRIGITDANGIIVPHYFRAFDMNYSIQEEANKIIANLACGRLFPTQMPYYIGNYNDKFGTVGLDLNHIENVKSLRLDNYLLSKGIELNSITSLMKAYREGAFDNELTKSAIAQLMYSMFTLPNAIGEQDPNTRNAVLLGPNDKNAKYDSIVRIDFEKNIINDSGNNYNNTRIYPFGMFHKYETENEFHENIIKAVTDKLITPEEVNMLLAIHKATEYITAEKNTNKVLEETLLSNQINNTSLADNRFFNSESIENYFNNIKDCASHYTNKTNKFLTEAADKNNICIKKSIDYLPSLEKK
ncbi:MAG: hypothetical protein MJ054_00960 [Clostridia bacterium]|nr:hypothetical protein [Clostridia bacterium]